MMFKIDPKHDLEDAWEVLEKEGCLLLYTIEENGDQYIFGELPKGVSSEGFIESIPFIHEITEDPFSEIDWNSQWAQHGHGFRDGFLYVELGTNIPEVRLKPGPGFGDLSHPTTRLVLKLMRDYVKGHNVLDIGCGSGVLSVAAAALGAKSVFGIDIDKAAVEHSVLNAEINGMEERVFFTTSVKVLVSKIGNSPLVVLMNMIQSEQEVAWASLKQLHGNVERIIASGILAEDEEVYIEAWNKMGWKVENREEEEGWTGYLLGRI